MNKPIDWSKELTTRDGRKDRLLGELTGRGDDCMVVAIMGRNNRETSGHHYRDGSYFGPVTSDDRDLINTPVRIKREYWVNVYPTGLPSGPYADRDTAESVAHPLRVACIKQVIDCAEGEGL